MDDHGRGVESHLGGVVADRGRIDGLGRGCLLVGRDGGARGDVGDCGVDLDDDDPHVVDREHLVVLGTQGEPMVGERRMDVPS